ncbi:hypothetical protein [Paracoccus pantotrophus]|uniref:hypothetical protein n=1 Tax=Paracoccus pantotrophus TaxID=82367 RepID=UPI0012DFA68F|nr:hypothetical protein [Paracoccus pantotrophus]
MSVFERLLTPQYIPCVEQRPGWRRRPNTDRSEIGGLTDDPESGNEMTKAHPRPVKLAHGRYFLLESPSGKNLMGGDQ